MSARYDLSPVALDDIDAAAAFMIYDAFDMLARNPHLGHQRSDLTPLPVFFWTASKSYAVIYRKTDPLQIVRVLAWKQDVPTLLSDESGFAPS